MFAQAPSHYPRPLPAILNECAWFLRRSQSISTLLTPFLVSGALTLVITAVTLLSLGTPGASFTGSWMESWLTAWPIAFPLVWLASPRRAARPAGSAGLGIGSIESASRRVTARHGMTVRRGLQSRTAY